MSLCITLGATQFVAAQPAGSCDGTTGNDTINCTISPTNPENQIDGDLGSDQITQGAGVTTSFIDSDGQSGTADAAGAGNGGNDTIVNNGTVTISISGDYSTGKPGNDVIINNGTAAEITGDESTDTNAQNGIDQITNNGTVTGSIYGDAVPASSLTGGTGGSDTITNNGTVNQNIIGDSGNSGVGAIDTITNNGTVTGNIDAGGANDVVKIGKGATVGGTIDGGAGTDTLQFNFNSSSEAVAAAAVLAGLSPAGASATFGSHAYTWTNFEQLQAVYISPPSTPNAAPIRNYYTTSTPTLTWNRVTWAATYDIQVDNTSDFSSPLDFAKTGLPSTQLSIMTTPLVNRQYYWHVRACPATGPCGTWSATDTFIVDA